MDFSNHYFFKKEIINKSACQYLTLYGEGEKNRIFCISNDSEQEISCK